MVGCANKTVTLINLPALLSLLALWFIEREFGFDFLMDVPISVGLKCKTLLFLLTEKMLLKKFICTAVGLTVCFH